MPMILISKIEHICEYSRVFFGEGRQYNKSKL